jgi:carbon-monoxide dehydrogenase medium subunit
MSLPPFEYLAPTTTSELAGLLAMHQDKCRILAGGTDLINWMAEKIYRPDYVIDLRKLPLAGISYEKGQGLTIGAAATIEAIERSPIVRQLYYALVQAAGQIGSPQIRAMATVGGNCCNASPCADMPPPLITLGATVVLSSTRGPRELPLESFITGNRQTAIQPDEFLESVRVPDPWPRSACRYSPFGLRAAQEIDIASVAVNIAIDPATGLISNARIAMGEGGGVPRRQEADRRRRERGGGAVQPGVPPDRRPPRLGVVPPPHRRSPRAADAAGRPCGHHRLSGTGNRHETRDRARHQR